jgi:hypothetical protein
MSITIVTNHWQEDIEWLKQSPFPVVVIDKVGAAPSSFTPHLIVENKGLDISSMFSYIIHNYDNLPEYMAFIHGHENSEHQMHDRPLLYVIAGANILKYKYIPLNNFFRSYPFFNEPSNVPGIPGLMLADHWARLGFEPLPENFILNIPCSNQFIVARERVLRWPKHKWQEWLDLVTNSEKQEIFIWCVVFECILHIILGECASMPIVDDWFVFPYKTKWFHELPEFYLNNDQKIALGIEVKPNNRTWVNQLQ